MKKILINAMMCVFAVCASAQYKTADPGWKSLKQFNILFYEYNGKKDIAQAPDGQIYFTLQEDEDGEVYCTISLQLDENNTVFDPGKVYKFKGAEVRITSDGCIGIVDKFNNPICIWSPTDEKNRTVLYIYDIVQFL